MKNYFFLSTALATIVWSCSAAQALNPSPQQNDDQAQQCQPQPAQPFGVEPAVPNPFENALERYRPVPPPVTYDLRPLPQPGPSPLDTWEF